MNPYNAAAGPSRRIKPTAPFESARHKPSHRDGKFRVVLVSTGSVASVKIPDIVGSLSKIPEIEIQVVATRASLHFYNQAQLDEAVKRVGPTTYGDAGIDGDAQTEKQEEYGVKIWRDEDEWSDWTKIGEPILHIELRKWADLVVVAPCSADFLAKIAAGFSDNLALSMMRALSPDTPVILCPAMNTHMYQHPFTSDHLKSVQERLGYMISGPQGAGTLACGDEGPGKMTDWRDVVSMIENFGAMFIRCQNNSRHQIAPLSSEIKPPTFQRSTSDTATPSGQQPHLAPSTGLVDVTNNLISAGVSMSGPSARELDPSAHSPRVVPKREANGGDGQYWSSRWWLP